MRLLRITSLLTFLGLFWPTFIQAGAGDPQIGTDHPWYPGELSCSTFDRLFATQAQLFERLAKRPPQSDEDRALAAWIWRNTHYWHCEEGPEDLWGQGWGKGMDSRCREYWTGLFAQGFGLCGTTHSQWSAEMEILFGHGRCRGVGVQGHNSFEVFLTGGAYGSGRWALLDHDVSAVIFDPTGKRLLSISEVRDNWKQLADPRFKPDRQHGWPLCGLHPDDGSVYQRYDVAEYLPGYAGPPPRLLLRRGEAWRRYLQPGLEDGKTFVFWGHNMNAGGIPGPERSRSWVNQPEKFRGTPNGTGYHDGQARFANAVSIYQPNFSNGDYREGVVSESDQHVTFDFQSPYIIAAAPSDPDPWGILKPGCRHGLVLRGQPLPNQPVFIEVSVDRGRTWSQASAFANGLDLTDHVKGYRQYQLKFKAPASILAQIQPTITTVCQANGSTMPQLKSRGSVVQFVGSGLANISAGPTLPQAQTHVVGGKFGSPEVILELAPPQKDQPVRALHAAAHVLSGSPPRSDVRYQIDYSLDGGQSWQPLVRDWTISRQGQEPKDFWSQSFCWGSAKLDSPSRPVRIRFHNNGGKVYARAEVHLTYALPKNDPVETTFAWLDSDGKHQASHVNETNGSWTIPTKDNVQTRWIEFAPRPKL